MTSQYVYPYSFNTAKSDGDVDIWRESLLSNEYCRKAIEKTITENYNDACLNEDAAMKVITEFGYDRVNWVLATSVQQRIRAGQFSRDNVEWAKGFCIPDRNAGHTEKYTINTHAGVLDLFVRQARNAYAALDLYDISHCQNADKPLNYEGRVLVLRPTLLKYKMPSYQLILGQGGFGCNPSAIGRKVYGVFLLDGEKCQYNRTDFIGVLKDELLPDWVKEKLEAMNLRASDPEQTENNEQNTGMTPSL